MTEWAAKRFWKKTTVASLDQGWTVHLDDRPVKTPGKASLVLPTQRLAVAIAAEWNAQSERIDPSGMPLTRAANSAIDKVAVQRAEVTDMLASYGQTDLLCYRAETPDQLAQRQATAWDPLLAWAAQELDAPLNVTTGVMYVDQPSGSLSRLKAEVAGLSVFELTAFHDLVALSGSLVIALAVIHRHGSPEDLWAASRVDEIWQAELWGHDDEAAAQATRKKSDFLQAMRLFNLLREVE